MELHYEASLSAYIIMHEVLKELNLMDPVEERKINEYAKRIMRRCNRIIEKRYSSVKQNLLKNYISNILREEYGIEVYR